MEAQPSETIPSYLEAIAEELRQVDHKLKRLVSSTSTDSVLAGELRGGIEVVRKDLLGDAIGTLIALSELDESTAARRYLEAVDRLERAGRRVSAERPILHRPEALVQYLIARHTCLDQEVLGAVYVDVQNRLIADIEIFRGTLHRLKVEPRVVLRQALERGASGFLLWHTHPSGDPSPTTEDVLFTRRLAASAELLGIRLLDPLILGEPERWVSLNRWGGWEAEETDSEETSHE